MWKTKRTTIEEVQSSTNPKVIEAITFNPNSNLQLQDLLFNVLGGSMSLVGQRPQVAAEVALYSDAAHRRLLAKPGITGRDV